MAELYGPAYLADRLKRKRLRVKVRYNFYEMKYSVPDFGISTPPKLRSMMTVLGWCGKAVDNLADRLQFYRFEDDTFGFNEILNMNNRDVLLDSAILGALIGSCSFVYISPDETGYPRLQVIDGKNATGVMDPITNLLTEGYAVLSEDEHGEPIDTAYFTPDMTVYYSEGKEIDRIENPALYPLLVPIVNRPDATRPFGHSRISRACMDYVLAASRTVKRSEVSAEFFSFPQKYVTGLSEDAEISDKWAAAMSSMIAFTKDEDGDHPLVGQFQTGSMTPHADQLRMYASLFAGETGLTLDDLGFVTSNPSSAEAIKAAHENLRLTARKAQRDFGTGFVNVGYIAASLRDGIPYERKRIYEVRPVWESIFEPDANAMSSIGDGVLKINQAMPGYIDERIMRELTGLKK